MNKTLTVNIGGIVFHIEERAYDSLKKYLESIKGHFTMSDGRDEIMQDIEARIAEMLQERVSDSKQVIVEEDVTQIITVMGKPEQFSDETESNAGSAAGSSYTASSTVYSGQRRFYRDTEDRVIGGVCAGIAHRIGIDPIWVRLIFILLLFAVTTSFWVYIILLIIIPKAVTPTQKLEMRGEPVNINSLRREFETDAPATSKARSTVNRFFDVIGEIIAAIFKAIVYGFAAIFGFAGIFILIALFLLLLGVLGVEGIIHPAHLLDAFATPSQQVWSVVAAILLVGVPVFIIVYKVVKMIFKIKTTHPWLRTSALILWIAGWILGFYMFSVIAREYTDESHKKTNIELMQPVHDTLYVDITRDPQYEDLDWDTNFGVRFGKRWHAAGHNDQFYLHDNIKLRIEKAEGNKFELVQLISARGRTEQQAYQNASKISYKIEQHDSLLLLSDIFPFPEGQRFRDQTVEMILKIPMGKSVYLADKTKHILNDIDNVTHTWDWDMVNHTWTMTEKGLQCIGCNLNDNSWDSDDEHNSNTSASISIDSTGVHIATENDTIVSKNVKISVSDKGVHINTGKKRK